MRLVKKDNDNSAQSLGTFKLGNDEKTWTNKKICIAGGIGVFGLILLIIVLSSGDKSNDDNNKPDPKPVRPNPHGYDESILDTQDLFKTEPVCKNLGNIFKNVE